MVIESGAKRLVKAWHMFRGQRTAKRYSSEQAQEKF